MKIKEEPLPTDIGERLQSTRIAARKSVSDYASALGVTDEDYLKAEKGLHPISMRQLIELSLREQLSLHFLLFALGSPFAGPEYTLPAGPASSDQGDQAE